jgi:hypothetical protein
MPSNRCHCLGGDLGKPQNLKRGAAGGEVNPKLTERYFAQITASELQMLCAAAGLPVSAQCINGMEVSLL